MSKAKLPLFLLAAWFVFASFPGSLMAFQPRTRFTSAPVPQDPHELVTGAIQIASQPAERQAVLTLLRRAADNAISHQPNMAPFHFTV